MAGSASSEAEQINLDALIMNATNPTVKHEDPNAVQAVVQAVSRDATAPATVVKILAHKTHSPQETEAMKALSVLQACIINCGPMFHFEIGKFKFLNEMIKLVSPKYAGNTTPPAIKSRVLELLFCWMTDLTHEPKIAEAYNMLKKQSIVKTDPVYIGPLRVVAAPRSAPSSIEDTERSQLLQRLLQSKRPEDLDKANALIKAMVRDDQKRIERTTHTALEIEMARNNVKVLDEMLSEHEQRSCDSGHVTLMGELHHTCNNLRNTLYQTIAQCTDTQADMSDLILVNEELSRVIGRYKMLVRKSTTPGEAKDNYVVTKANGNASAPTTDGAASPEERGISTPAVAEGSSGPSLITSDIILLDLSIPKEDKPVSSATTDLINQELSVLGLGDNSARPPAESCPPPPTTSAAATLMEQLGSVAFSSSGDSDVITPTSMMQGLVAPMIPQAKDKASAPANCSDASPRPPPPNALDQLDVLGSSLLQSALPPNTGSVGRIFKQPEKLSINQLKQRVAAPLSPAVESFTPALQQQLLVPVPVTSTSSTSPDSNGDPISNNSAIFSSNVISLTSVVSAGKGKCIASTGLLEHSEVSRLSGSKNVPESGRREATDAEPAASKAQFLEVKPLGDIQISMENIKPGTRAAVVLLESGGVSLSLHHTLNSPRSDVRVFVLTLTSQCRSPVTQYLMQAVVPRACKVRLLLPSATHLPQYSPFLPPPAVTQLMLVANPNQVNLSVKLMLSYCVEDEPVTEMIELDRLEL